MRAFKRYDAIVEVTAVSGSTFWTGFTRDISKGGLFLACEEQLPVGTVIRFRFCLPPDAALHEVEAEVRWTRSASAANEDAPAGMGLRFVVIDDPVRDAIERFIETQRESLFYDDDDL